MAMELLSDNSIWLIRHLNKMCYHKKNYFQGGVSESAKVDPQTIDYIEQSIFGCLVTL